MNAEFSSLKQYKKRALQTITVVILFNVRTSFHSCKFLRPIRQNKSVRGRLLKNTLTIFNNQEYKSLLYVPTHESSLNQTNLEMA